MRRSWTFIALVIAAFVITIVPGSEQFDLYAEIPTECPTIDSIYETVHLAHEWDCTKFYKCDHGNRVLFECPMVDEQGNRLYFNPVSQVCDWPNVAGCIPGERQSTSEGTTEGRFTQQTITSATGSTPVVTDDWNQNGTVTPSGHFVPHATNCSLFWEIVNGEKILHECPAGLHFSPSEEVCDWPDRAGCESTTPVSTETTTSSGPTCGIPCGDIIHGSVIPHECVCSKFYRCANGDLILQQCPIGLHFNPSIYGCDWPESAGCLTTTQAPVTDQTTTEVSFPTECPAENPGYPVKIPHPTNCSLYYKCKDGEKILSECPDDLHFNPVLQMCDWADSAGCVSSTPADSSTVSPTPTGTEPVPTECPPDNSGPTVHLPYPYNCSLFYTCDNGEKVVQSCPPGLEFNAKIQECDWPEFAGCTVSTVSDLTTEPTRPSTTERTRPPTTEPTRPPTTEPTRTSTTERTRPPTTEPTRPSTTERTRPPTTESTRPPTTEPTRTSTTERTRPTTEPTRPSTTERTRPPTTEPTRPPTTEPTRTSTTERTRPPTTEPTRPSTTERTRPPTTESTRPPTTEPTRTSTTERTRPPTTEPTRPSTTEPTRPPTTEPTRPPTTEPTRPTTTERTRPPTTEPTRPPTTEPTQPSTTERTRPPTTEPTRPPTTEPTRPSTTERTRPPTTEPTRPPTTEPTQPSTTERTQPPTTEPTRPPTTESTRPSTTERTRPPTTEPTRPPTTEPTQPSTTERTQPPTTEPTRPPTTEPTRPPTTEPTRPPTTEPTRPPTTEPTRPSTTERTRPPTTEPTRPPTTEPTRPSTTERTRPPTTEPTRPSTTERTRPPTTEPTTPSITTPNVDTTTPVLPTECPPDNSGPPVHLPYPFNCTLYYRCDNGEKVLESCSPALEFNPETRECDWPENAGCVVSTTADPQTTWTAWTWITTPPTTSSEPPTTRPSTTIEQWSTISPTSIPASECPPDVSGVQIPHETNCSLYYECNDGKKELKECTPGLHFSPALEICEWPENAGCESITPTPGPSTVTDAVITSTPIPANFTDDFEGEGTSTSAVTSPTTTLTPGLPRCIGTCPSKDPEDYTVLLPNEDCTKFCKCSNSRPYVYECPAKLHFSPTKFVCDYPRRAKCQGRGGSGRLAVEGFNT